MIISTKEHYDMLIDEECDPFRDNEILKAYMKRWDGQQFYEKLCLRKEKIVLEVGIGTGRVAQNVLGIGCKHLTGIDVSQKTIQRAKENLNIYNNLSLLVEDIEEYKHENHFDLIYSVLTFMHIEDKWKALSNIVSSLKPGGDVVLSISEQSEWLDYGERKVRLYPKSAEYYMQCLEKLGCRMINKVELIDTLVFPNGQRSPEYGQKIATIIKATKQ